MDSILTSVKKAIGIEENYVNFDPDIIMFINTVISVLTQLGLGPSEGVSITDASNDWSELLGDRKDLEFVKTLIYLKVKLLFDPPASSFVLDAIKDQIKELEWRVNTLVDKPTIVVVEGGLQNGG